MLCRHHLPLLQLGLGFNSDTTVQPSSIIIWSDHPVVLNHPETLLGLNSRFWWDPIWVYWAFVVTTWLVASITHHNEFGRNSTIIEQILDFVIKPPSCALHPPSWCGVMWCGVMWCGVVWQEFKGTVCWDGVKWPLEKLWLTKCVYTLSSPLMAICLPYQATAFQHPTPTMSPSQHFQELFVAKRSKFLSTKQSNEKKLLQFHPFIPYLHPSPSSHL